jgi:hypothetical protein
MPSTLLSITNNYRLPTICNDCAHTTGLNVHDLADRLGQDHPIPAIRQRLKCMRTASPSYHSSTPSWIA